MTTLRPGDRCAGLRIAWCIHRTSWSTVYVCLDEADERHVIKLVARAGTEQAEATHMLWDEGRILSHVRHPNVVRLLGMGENLHGAFLHLEYLPGGSLASLVRRGHQLGLRLPPALVAHVGMSVALGLHAAHRACDEDGPLQVVHRDVAPPNILLSPDGGVKLCDFGVAHARSRRQKTEARCVKGRWSYIAPEYLKGGSVDPRVDVYSLGVVLWELLMGKKLFPESSLADLVRAVQSWDIPRPRAVDPNVPESLDRVVMRAIARNPAERFPNAGELALALDTCIADRAHAQLALGHFVRELTVPGISESATTVSGVRAPATPITAAAI